MELQPRQETFQWGRVTKKCYGRKAYVCYRLEWMGLEWPQDMNEGQ